MLEIRQIYEGIPLQNLSGIFILNPPSLARALFYPKKAKKDKKRENLKKKKSDSSLKIGKKFTKDFLVKKNLHGNPL